MCDTVPSAANSFKVRGQGRRTRRIHLRRVTCEKEKHVRDLELTVEEWRRALGVSRVRQGIFGKEEMEAFPVSVACAATETMMPGTVLVKLGQDLGRNKASLPMDPVLCISGKGCQSCGWI